MPGKTNRCSSVFCEDGEYHDVLWPVRWQKSIIDLIENYFYRDARDSDVIFMIQYQQVTGYCRYIFSRSKLEAAAGRRVAFEGIANVKIKTD